MAEKGYIPVAGDTIPKHGIVIWTSAVSSSCTRLWISPLFRLSGFEVYLCKLRLNNTGPPPQSRRNSGESRDESARDK